MCEHQSSEMNPLTWAVLLARWMDFARSAAALPEDGEAGLVRRSVTDIITLQAVWFALQQLEELSPAERALGIDRAGVLIQRHRDALFARFDGRPLPEDMQSLLDDVAAAYASRRVT